MALQGAEKVFTIHYVEKIPFIKINRIFLAI